jgi:hypothetical protein
MINNIYSVHERTPASCESIKVSHFGSRPIWIKTLLWLITLQDQKAGGIIRRDHVGKRPGLARRNQIMAWLMSIEIDLMFPDVPRCADSSFHDEELLLLPTAGLWIIFQFKRNTCTDFRDHGKCGSGAAESIITGHKKLSKSSHMQSKGLPENRINIYCHLLELAHVLERVSSMSKVNCGHHGHYSRHAMKNAPIKEID